MDKRMLRNLQNVTWSYSNRTQKNQALSLALDLAFEL